MTDDDPDQTLPLSRREFVRLSAATASAIPFPGTGTTRPFGRGDPWGLAGDTRPTR